MADDPTADTEAAKAPSPDQPRARTGRDPTPTAERVYSNPAATRAAAVKRAEKIVAAALEERNRLRIAAGQASLYHRLEQEIRPCVRCIKNMVVDVKTRCSKETPRARCGRCASLKKDCALVPVPLYPRLAQLQRLRAKYGVARGPGRRTVKALVVIVAHRLTKRIEGKSRKKKGTGGATTVELEIIRAPLIAKAKFQRSLVDAIRGLADATNLAMRRLPTTR
ncbi:MAG: hypothetical protein M1826_003072 [Phylliscum demangeonii]|nr:MAG: hypothetical protein M1826_003072 [Phylliscum demangeonii]